MPDLAGVRFLWLLSTLFIVYGTTIPFEFVSDPAIVLAHLERVVRNPFVAADGEEWLSVPDLLQNVVLFVPFGLCAAILSARNGRPRMLRVVVLAGVLSMMVETLQLFTVGRTGSVIDVMTNTLGGWIGARIAPPVAGAFSQVSATIGLRRWALAPAAYPLLIVAGVVVVGRLSPFDFTIDPNAALWKARLFVIYPWQLGGPMTGPLYALHAATLAALVASWFGEIGLRKPEWSAVLVVAFASLFLETGQLLVESQMPGVVDGAAGVVGAAVGVIGFTVVRRRRAVTVFRLLVAIGSAGSMIALFTTSALCDPVFVALACIGLGFSATPWRWRASLAVGSAIVTTLALVIPLSMLQGSIAGRSPDPRSIAAAAVGAMCGGYAATAGWRRFRVRAAQPVSDLIGSGRAV